MQIFQDIEIYNHFNKTLWRRVDEYGRAKFEEELQKLKALKHHVKREVEESDPKNINPPVTGPKNVEWMAAIYKYMSENSGDCFMPN